MGHYRDGLSLRQSHPLTRRDWVEKSEQITPGTKFKGCQKYKEYLNTTFTKNQMANFDLQAGGLFL